MFIRGNNKNTFIVDGRKRSFVLKRIFFGEERKERMGAVLSAVLGGAGEAAADAGSESEPSRVMKFSSSARWQLHFNEIKESSKLVCVSIRFDPIQLVLQSMSFRLELLTDLRVCFL